MMRKRVFLCFSLLVFSITTAGAQDSIKKDEGDVKDAGNVTTSESATLSDSVTIPEVTADKPMSFWMEKKIEYSKEILGALTASRYDDIEKRSDQLRLLGKIEGFVRGRNPEYAKHLEAFDLATRELRKQARAQDIEGATKAFHRLTTSCVDCHYSLREPKTAP